MSAYKQVLDHALQIRTLESVCELISWDQETLMPPAANEHRTAQKVLLSRIAHDKRVDPAFFGHLESLLHAFDEDSDEAIIVNRIHRDIEKARRLPADFVEEMARATSTGIEAWQQARERNEWKLFLPHLESIISLSRKKADFLGYKDHPYDALLDEYDPGMTTAKIGSFFSSLKPKLIFLLDEIRKTPFFKTNYKTFSSSHHDQFAACKDLLTRIGVDWDRARMDTSAHPFSTSPHPTDSRFTIRRTSDDLLNQVMAALHEAGHTMYDLGLQQQHYGTPLAEPASLSIHESQSRFWETLIGKSKIFVPHIFSTLSQNISGTLPYKNEEDLYEQLNLVACTPIRIEADEVTYPLHVILRFEIEKELLEGTLAPKELPERWNAGMQELLGITPKNDQEGCLQDVHWSFGLVGYFPTYTLGSLFSVCWFSAMKKDLPHLDELIKKGTFAPICSWLQEHVWNHGRRFFSYDLVARSLGREPTEDDYISYLREKYVG